MSISLLLRCTPKYVPRQVDLISLSIDQQRMFRLEITRRFSYRRRRLRGKKHSSTTGSNERSKTPAILPGQIDQEQKYHKPWWKYLTIWPVDDRPYVPDYVDSNRARWPNTISGFRMLFKRSWEVFKRSWEVYKSTHEGWLLPEKKNGGEANNGIKKEDDFLSEEIERHRGEIRENVTRNVDFLQTEGKDVLDDVKKQTGIHTVQDLRAWAGEQLQLANKCLQEFMSGYRQGRDDEVEKMLNEYFQDLSSSEEDEEKKRRRRPKRRVRTL